MLNQTRDAGALGGCAVVGRLHNGRREVREHGVAAQILPARCFSRRSTNEAQRSRQTVRISRALALQVARRATKPIERFIDVEIDDATVRRRGKISTIEEVTA